MPRHYERKPGTRLYGEKTRYSEEQLQDVLGRIRRNEISQREASKIYQIPRQTLINKLSNKHSNAVGRPVVFSEEEEVTFVQHCLFVSKMGIPIGLIDLRYIIKGYLDSQRRNVLCFKGNMPGYEWGKCFLKRHKVELKECFAKHISQKRAAVNEEGLRNFFACYEKEVEGVPPTNIFNFDETGFHDVPSSKKLIFPRTLRHPEKILNQTKTCYTTVFCGSAEGQLLPPYVIFNGKQKWGEWLINAPPNTRLNVSDSGWIEQPIFEDWLQQLFLPFIQTQNISGKIILLCDNLSAHVSIRALQICEANNISFICFPPNATHLLQPLDLTFFASLKTEWRNVLNEWRTTRDGKKKVSLPKGIFIGLLKNTLERCCDKVEGLLRKGFQKSGLYPLDCERVIKDLPEYAKSEVNIVNNVSEEFKKYIEGTRETDLTGKQGKKMKIPVDPGKSVSVEQVQKFYIDREEDRKRKEREKEEKVKLREEKKIKRTELRKQGPRTRGGPRRRGGGLRTLTNNSEFTKPSCSWETPIVLDGPSNLPNEELTNFTSDICVDDYVIVSYLEKLFPGKVIEVNLCSDSTENTYKVRCMARKGKQWIWPEKPDEILYEREDIIKKILEDSIKVINKRGMLDVKERLLYDEEEFELFRS